jgi:osmoprotectant transport system permease protein
MVDCAGVPVMMAWHPHRGGVVIGTARHPLQFTNQPRNYIFAGLQTQNWVFVLFGCPPPRLALVVDQLWP